MGHTVVIGGGGAGLTAAIAARKAGAGVLLLSKTKVGTSCCTSYSGGGFSLPAGKNGGTEAFRKATRNVGREMNHSGMLETFVAGCEAGLREIQSWGVTLRFTDDGHAWSSETAPNPVMGGGGMVSQLAAIARAEGVQFLEDAMAVSIRTRNGAVSGVEAIEWRTGKTHALPASSVILATGGGGRIYERTDNPARMTGDGYALALDLGLSLIDMEFVQFYPLGLDEPDLPVWMIGLPIVDIVRLTDGSGREFMKEAFASWGIKNGWEANFLARDRSARLVQSVWDSGDAATLHFEDLSGEVLRSKKLQELLIVAPEGITHGKGRPVRVRPIQHYFCGGVTVDGNAETSVPGLFACGEVTGGVDGASRIGGNALTNLVTFGLLAGRGAATHCGAAGAFVPEAAERLLKDFPDGTVSPESIRKEIASVVESSLGPVRNGAGCREAAERLEILSGDIRRVTRRPGMELLHALELSGLSTTATAVARAASLREESRGTHCRTEFPEERDCWKRPVRVLLENGKMTAR